MFVLCRLARNKEREEHLLVMTWMSKNIALFLGEAKLGPEKATRGGFLMYPGVV